MKIGLRILLLCVLVCFTLAESEGCISEGTCEGRSCGVVQDKCGNSVDCGSCESGSTCNDEKGVCECQPFTCEALTRTCGVISDGCGQFIACGDCDDGEQCNLIGECEPVQKEGAGKRSEWDSHNSHVESSIKQRELAMSGAFTVGDAEVEAVAEVAEAVTELSEETKTARRAARSAAARRRFRSIEEDSEFDEVIEENEWTRADANAARSAEQSEQQAAPAEVEQQAAPAEDEHQAAARHARATERRARQFRSLEGAEEDEQVEENEWTRAARNAEEEAAPTEVDRDAKNRRSMAGDHASHADSHAAAINRHREAAMSGAFLNGEVPAAHSRRSAGSHGHHESHIEHSMNHREKAMAGVYRQQAEAQAKPQQLRERTAAGEDYSHHARHMEHSQLHREKAMAGAYKAEGAQENVGAKPVDDDHSLLFAFFAYGLPVLGIAGIAATAYFLVQKQRKPESEGYFSIINNNVVPSHESLKSRRSSKHAISIAPSPLLTSGSNNNNNNNNNNNSKVEPINLNSSTHLLQKQKVGTPRLRMNSPAVQSRMSPKISPANLKASQTFSL